MKTTISTLLLLSTTLPLAAQGAAVRPALEMRLVAKASDSLDLSVQKTKLLAWLQRSGNAKRVRDARQTIAEFNGLVDGLGGPDPRVLWAPHAVRPTADGTRWGFAQSRTDGAPAVPLFAAAEYDAAPTRGDARLWELVALEGGPAPFTAADLDAESIQVTSDEAGRAAIAYSLEADRVDAYRAFTRQNTDRQLALVQDGVILTAPALRGEIAGAGIITGAFTDAEAQALAQALRAAVENAGVAVATTLVDAPDLSGEEIPSSADPADIRAMQGAQAMLEAERRLREMLKAGKIEGIDQILTFEEIESWPYEDGLLGMPKAIKKLDKKQVLMTGFMLPIDEVENIKEFLLVQSLWSCCYGQPPDINGIVRVVMQGDARIDYQFEPIKVVGTFRVEETIEDGYCVDIYNLQAESVTVIQ